MHRVVVRDVADVSGVHAASIFKIDPEDGDSIYVRNINIAHKHTVQQPKHRISLNN
jgi:hypothetical protein